MKFDKVVNFEVLDCSGRVWRAEAVRVSAGMHSERWDILLHIAEYGTGWRYSRYMHIVRYVTYTADVPHTHSRYYNPETSCKISIKKLFPKWRFQA